MALYDTLERATQVGRCDQVRYRGRLIIGRPDQVKSGLVARSPWIAPQGLISIGNMPALKPASQVRLVRVLAIAYLDRYHDRLRELDPYGEWPAKIYQVLLRSAIETTFGPEIRSSVVARLSKTFRRVHISPRSGFGAETARHALVDLVTSTVNGTTSSEATRVLADASNDQLGYLDTRWVASLLVNFVAAFTQPLAAAAAWVAMEGADSALRPDVDTMSFARETLRLHPPAWIIARRKLNPDGSMSTSYFSPFLSHRHPSAFARPNDFDWSRAPSLGGSFIPFGTGPFGCPGASVAMSVLGQTIDWLRGAATYQTRTHRGSWRVGPILAPPRFALQPSSGRILQ